MHAHMMYKRNILYFAKQNVHEKRANILYWRRGNGAWTTSLQEKDMQCPKRHEQGLVNATMMIIEGKYQTIFIMPNIDGNCSHSRQTQLNWHVNE